MFTNKSLLPNDKKRKHKIVGTAIRVNGRVTGQVIGKDYVKDIKNSHMLKNPEAIANNISALHDAERAGAEYCKFTNIDTGIVYRASIAKIWDLGRHVDFGYGSQQALTLSHWLQTVDETITSQSEAPEYSDADSTHAEVKPLHYKSHATVGMVYEPGKPMQLDLWGRRK
jgi:hypothetical protein